MRVSIFGMNGNHTFERVKGSDPFKVASRWLEMLQHRDEFDLCPAIVIDDNGKELRRVGDMVFHDTKRDCAKNPSALMDYVEELFTDPDIPRLLQEQYGGEE
jgi:hypothetical protein